VPPTFSAGEFKHLEIQETFFKKRLEIERYDLSVLPITLIDQKLLEDLKEGMGGALMVTRTISATPFIIDQGFFVISSSIKNIGGGLQIKDTERIDQWPVLQEVHTDPQTGIIVNITKTMIPPIPAPTPGNTGGSKGQYVEILPIDKWRSIQIVSSVDCSSLPDPITWSTTHRYELPPILLNITPWWNPTTKNESQSFSSGSIATAINPGSGAAGSSVLAYASARGLITYNATAGVHGDFPARITRVYYCGPPTQAQLPGIFKFQPVDGSAVIAGATGMQSQSVGPGGTGDRNVLSAAATTTFEVGDRVDIRGVLTSGNPTILGPTTFITPIVVTPGITVADGNGVLYTPIDATQAAMARLIVSFPLGGSTPFSYRTGDTYTVAVNVERWRFGIFIMEQVVITVPFLNS
jgi:hypothetical protein